MDEKKLIDAGYKTHRALIRAHMAHLRHSIKQSEAGQLYDEMRKREHEHMLAECELRNISGEGVPPSYNVLIGGDNKEAKERVDELAAMLNEPQNLLEGRDWIQIDIDGEAMQKGLDEMKKKISPIEYAASMITVRRKEEEIPVGEAVDMTPWDSSTE